MSNRPSARRGLIVLIGSAVMVALALLLAWRLGLFNLVHRNALVAAVVRLHHYRFLAWGFTIAAALAIAVGCPVTLLAILGGALFGLVGGLALCWVAAMGGAVIGYELASKLRADTRALLIGRYGSKIRQFGGADGFMSVFRLRLIPVVPFALVNIAAAVAEVPRRDYLIASALGSIPSIVAYTFCGQGVLAGAEGAGHRALVRVAIAAGLLVVLSFAPSVIQSLKARRGRRAHS